MLSFVAASRSIILGLLCVSADYFTESFDGRTSEIVKLQKNDLISRLLISLLDPC